MIMRKPSRAEQRVREPKDSVCVTVTEPVVVLTGVAGQEIRTSCFPGIAVLAGNRQAHGRRSVPFRSALTMSQGTPPGQRMPSGRFEPRPQTERPLHPCDSHMPPQARFPDGGDDRDVSRHTPIPGGSYNHPMAQLPTAAQAGAFAGQLRPRQLMGAHHGSARWRYEGSSFAQLADLLEKERVRYAVIGGIAVQLYTEEPRTTRDIDGCSRQL